MTPVNKTQPCLKCGTNTTQTLAPSPKGASWKCNSCNSEVLGYTHQDMMKIVSEKVFGLRKTQKKVDVPEGLKVFLKHHGEGPDEMEAAEHSVKTHIEITGELPKVGGQMFTKPTGAHPMMAVPYGEVVRVEGTS